LLRKQHQKDMLIPPLFARLHEVCTMIT
jgi:hypothetical protein